MADNPHIKWFPIEQVGGYVSAVEREETPSVLALDNLGVHTRKRGMVSQRDNGCQHRTRTIPIRPNAFVTVTDASNSGGTIRITTGSAHGCNTNDIVYVNEIVGTVEANGRWPVTVIDPTTLDLQGSVYATPYISGGILTKTPIVIVDGFTMYDKDNDREHEVLVGLDSSNYLRFYVNAGTVAGTEDWKELGRRITAKANGAPVSRTINIDTLSETISNDSVQYWIARNRTQENTALVVTNTASAITVDNDLSGAPGGMGWQDDDDIDLYQFTFGYLTHREHGTTPFNLGLTPWVSTDPVDAQVKTNVAYGTSAIPQNMRKPFCLIKSAARPLFHATGVGTPLRTLPAGWYAEGGGGGLNPTHQEIGSPSATHKTTDANATVDVEDQISGDTWLRFTVRSTTPAGLATYPIHFIKVCLVYEGYQFSEPVLTIYRENANPSTTTWGTLIDTFVNLAKMNKRITGIATFQREFSTAEVAAGVHLKTVPDNEYRLEGILAFGDETEQSEPYYIVRDTWANDNWEDGLSYQATMTWNVNGVSATDIKAPTLTDTLGHATVLTGRSILTPRYMARVARNQGALRVVDENDKRLHLTVYSLLNIHMDDHFAFVTEDVRVPSNKLIIDLIGRGPLLGVAIWNDTIWAFREREFETYDLQSGIQTLQPGDFYAQRSLIVCDDGMFWLGKYGAYWVRPGREDIQRIEPDWVTELVGQDLIDDASAAYITDAYRQAAIGGHSPNTAELVLQLQRNKDVADGGGSEYIVMAFSPSEERWRRRRFNIGTSSNRLVRFSRRKDGTMTLVHLEGLLQYPVLTGAKRFQDDVNFDGISRSKGVEMSLMVNIPDLSSHRVFGDLVAVKIVYEGASSDGYGVFQFDIYPNRERESYDTQYFPLDDDPEERMCENIGLLQGMRFKVSIPSTDLVNALWLDISKVLLGFAIQPADNTI